MKARRPIALLAVLALAGGLTACGNKPDRVTAAETEGEYVDVGPLKYQVQISRQLNAKDIEDSEYLKGVNDKLQGDEVWFAVFMRVQNETKHYVRPATSYKIEDTQSNEFVPVVIDQKANPFAYNPIPIPPKNLLPRNDSTAAQTSVNGELLLFRIPRQSLDNRPLELTIQDPQNADQASTVNLDV